MGLTHGGESADLFFFSEQTWYHELESSQPSSTACSPETQILMETPRARRPQYSGIIPVMSSLHSQLLTGGVGVPGLSDGTVQQGFVSIADAH